MDNSIIFFRFLSLSLGLVDFAIQNNTFSFPSLERIGALLG